MLFITFEILRCHSFNGFIISYKSVMQFYTYEQQRYTDNVDSIDTLYLQFEILFT